MRIENIKKKKQTFSKEDRQMVNKHIKMCSAPLAIKEVQIKPTTRYHYTTIFTAKIMTTQMLSKMWRK